jgi:glycosyltransferase involved in cell wall biosynthesis
MTLLIVSNYLPDRQWSMLRFAELLAEGVRGRGHEVQVLHPPVWLGRCARPGGSAGKWLAYLDKFVLFPPLLAARSRRYDVVHVADHSNAPYRRWLRSKAVTATCHDLLAVRGALGEPTFCPASAMGRRLQAAILRNLQAIPQVACDSDATRADVSRLTGRSPGRNLRTILLSFSPSFRRPAEADLQTNLASLGLTGADYVLHVGSSQARKNREGLLRAVAGLGSRWNGGMVFAGERLRPEQQQLAADLGLDGRLRDLGRLSDAELASLYAGARAFVFPSFCEGFGWPVLEAQACGCPVITAGNTSLPEVAGEGALVLEAEDHRAIGEAILAMGSPPVREDWIRRGSANLARFTSERMVDEYERFFLEALADAA